MSSPIWGRGVISWKFVTGNFSEQRTLSKTKEFSFMKNPNKINGLNLKKKSFFDNSPRKTLENERISAKIYSV